MNDTRKPRQRVIIEPPEHLIKQRAHNLQAPSPVAVIEATPEDGIDPLAWLLDIGPETDPNPTGPEGVPEEDITVTETNEQVVDDLITLPEIFTIAEVAEWHQTFIAALQDRETALTVDAGATKTTDTAALQLLYAVCQQASRQQAELIWKDTSESLLAGLRLLGMPEDLLSSAAA